MTIKPWAEWTPDKNEVLFVGPQLPEGSAALAADRPAVGQSKRKPKRLPGQSAWRRPEGAKAVTDVGSPSGFVVALVVPVSSVAKDWGISTRRVRAMLVEGRLSGRQLDNGYWEVYYPYSYTFGTRGPAIKRQRDLPEKKQKQPEWMKEQF